MLLLLIACQSGEKHTDLSEPEGDDSAPAEDSLPTVPGDSDSDRESDSPDSPDSHGGDSEEDPVEPPPTPDVIVDCNGGADFTTIQSAIEGSVSGTLIGVMPCTYDEDINFIGKSLEVFGIDGAATTIIDGRGSGPVVTAIRGEGIGTRLAGVTISGGGGTYGAGLWMNGSALTLEDVTFTGSGRTYAVVYGEGISITLLNTTFHDNQVQAGGAVFYIDNGNMLAQGMSLDCGSADMGIYQHNATLILDSTINCPDADYAIYVNSGELAVRRSVVTGGAYGIFGADNNDTRNERMWVFNSTVVGSDTAASAGYMHFKGDNSVFYGGSKGLVFDHCHADSYIYDSALIGTDCAMQGDRYPYAIGWNAIGDGEFCRVEGFSTVVGDPQFVDAPDDFHLKSNSPLVDAGDPDEDQNDVDGSRNDVGAYGGSQGAW